MFLVQAFYGDDKRKWETVETFTSRDAAMARINMHRALDGCYLVELWEHAGCFHAVG